MTEETLPQPAPKNTEVKLMASSDSVYGLGMIGAWVYYIGKAETPRQIVKGFFKGLVWPAFVVYDVLNFLHKE